MKILVTGAAGFIGSHLVDFLLSKKHDVFGIDDLSGGFRENINKRGKFYQLDLRHKQKTIAIIKRIKPELIYHLAADATVGRSQFTPMLCTERNYNAYLHVLEGAIQAKVRRVIMTSSMSIYGNQLSPFSEDMPAKPVDIYGVAKTAMEDATKILSDVYKFEYTILRPHNVFGIRQNLADPYRNAVGIFINCMLQGKNFFIYGDGTQKRAFSYIDDVTSYIAKAGFLKKTNREIINIGPTTYHSINDMAKEVLSHFVNNMHDIPKHLRPVYLPSRPQEVKDAYCTNEKAIKLIGFKETVSLQKGIAEMVAWAKTIGPQKFHYLKNLELMTNDVPKTWRDKLI